MPVKSTVKTARKSPVVKKKTLSQSALAKAALNAKKSAKPVVKKETAHVQKTTESVKKPARAKKAKAPKTKGMLTQEQVQELLAFIVQKIDDGKGEEIVTIDLAGKTSFADYLVIASGTSARHIFGLANNLALDLKKAGFKVQLSGENGDGNWVVIDAIDIVVHLFTPQTREEYDIESLWKQTDK